MLRHTAATLLIETGVDIRFVQRLLGHSSIATTEIYTQATDEALRASLERANVLESLRM
jgi:integrase/recombinase XerD